MERENEEHRDLAFYAEFRDPMSNSRKRMRFSHPMSTFKPDARVSTRACLTNDTAIDSATKHQSTRPGKRESATRLHVKNNATRSDVKIVDSLPEYEASSKSQTLHTHHSQQEQTEVQLGICKPMISPQIESIDLVSPLVKRPYPLYLQVVLQQLTNGPCVSCVKKVTVRLPISCTTDEWGLVSLASVPELGFDAAPGLHVSRALLERSIAKAAERQISARVAPYASGSLSDDFVGKGFGVLAIPQLPRHVFVGPYVAGFLLAQALFKSFLKPLSLYSPLKPIQECSNSSNTIWFDPDSPVSSPMSDTLQIVEDEEDDGKRSDTASLERLLISVANESTGNSAANFPARDAEKEPAADIPSLENNPPPEMSDGNSSKVADNLGCTGLQPLELMPDKREKCNSSTAVAFRKSVEESNCLPPLELLPRFEPENCNSSTATDLGRNEEESRFKDLPLLELLPRFKEGNSNSSTAGDIRKNNDEGKFQYNLPCLKKHPRLETEKSNATMPADENNQRADEGKKVGDARQNLKTEDSSSDDDVLLIGVFPRIKAEKIFKNLPEDESKEASSAAEVAFGMPSNISTTKEQPLPDGSTKMEDRKIVDMLSNDNTPPEGTKDNMKNEFLETEPLAADERGPSSKSDLRRNSYSLDHVAPLQKDLIRDFKKIEEKEILDKMFKYLEVLLNPECSLASREHILTRAIDTIKHLKDQSQSLNEEYQTLLNRQKSLSTKREDLFSGLSPSIIPLFTGFFTPFRIPERHSMYKETTPF